MSEDKMREEFESRFGYKCYRQTEFGNYQHEETQQRWVGLKACAAIKDAEIAATKNSYMETCVENESLRTEIASRDLVIKELREGLLHIVSNCTPEGIGQNNLWIAAQTSLANSEHHNSRALEKMLLEAELKGYKRGIGKDGTDVLSTLLELEAKLAELNKEFKMKFNLPNPQPIPDVDLTLRIGNVYPAKGGNTSTKYWLVVGLTGNAVHMLGLDTNGCISGTQTYGQHVFNGEHSLFKRNASLVGTADLSHWEIDVNWLN